MGFGVVRAGVCAHACVSNTMPNGDEQQCYTHSVGWNKYRREEGLLLCSGDLRWCEMAAASSEPCACTYDTSTFTGGERPRE